MTKPHSSDDKWAQLALRVLLWRVAKAIEQDAAELAQRLRMV